jgi:acyl carrier protein
MALHDDTLRARVLDAFKAVAPDSDLDRLDPSRSFRDQFGIDSVDFLNFVMTLERELGLRIPEIDCPKLSSLDGCLAYLAPRLAGAGQPSLSS